MDTLQTGHQPKKRAKKQTPPQGGSATKATSSFIDFTSRNRGNVIYVRPKDIAAVGAHSDGSQTRLYVKNIIEEIIVMDTVENVLKKIIEFEKE